MGASNFNYSVWIGDEFEKQREAALKFYSDDVVKTTKFFDLDVEADLLEDYHDWIVIGNIYGRNPLDKTDVYPFYQDLRREPMIDRRQVEEELLTLDTILGMESDGTYVVQSRADYEASCLNNRRSWPGRYPSTENEVAPVTPRTSSLNLENEEAHSPHASESLQLTPRMEEQAVEDANETTRHLPTSNEADEDDANALEYCHMRMYLQLRSCEPPCMRTIERLR